MKRAAVHRVGVAGAETCHVEVFGAFADFLVRRERDADGPVRDLRVRHQKRGRRHDLGDAALVVGAEERRARGGHDVVAHTLAEVRRVGHAKHGRGVIGQHEVAAVPGAMHDRPHAGAGHLGRCIHMRHEANHRHRCLRRGRGNRRHHVAVGVQHRVMHPEGVQFVHERPQQHELAWSAGIRGGRLARLRVEGDVAEEAVEHRGGHAAP